MQAIIPQDLINVMLGYLPKYMTIMVQSFEKMTPEEYDQMMEHDLFEDDRLMGKYQEHMTMGHLMLRWAYLGNPLPPHIEITCTMIRAAASGKACGEYLMQLAEEYIDPYRFDQDKIECLLEIISRTLVEKRSYQTIMDLKSEGGPSFSLYHAEGVEEPVLGNIYRYIWEEMVESDDDTLWTMAADACTGAMVTWDYDHMRTAIAAGNAKVFEAMLSENMVTKDWKLEDWFEVMDCVSSYPSVDIVRILLVHMDASLEGSMGSREEIKALLIEEYGTESGGFAETLREALSGMDGSPFGSIWTEICEDQ